jgi:hypothetical protein
MIWMKIEGVRDFSGALCAINSAHGIAIALV